MWHCRVDVAYPQLSDWLHLQWVLRMKWASPISAMRGSDTLFPNDFGEDLFTMSALFTLLSLFNNER